MWQPFFAALWRGERLAAAGAAGVAGVAGAGGGEVCARKGYSVRRVEGCAGETVRRLLMCVENGCLLHIVLLLCAIKRGV